MTPRRKTRSASPPAPIDLNPRRDPELDFPAREPGEMRPGDWDRLGFLCGLEVHQQLATRRKLFCRCPSGRRTTRVDGEVLRHMRPTLSELGAYDGCALMEFKTNKEIVYLWERGTVCTYEIDDTPPFEIDEQAVRTALEIAALFDLSPSSELQVMRKQYLDGSIPTGFQRTAMVGVSGRIPFRESELGPGRELRIRQLTLEEDSCREVSDEGHRITFRTDRLGTPLIETVTEPDLLTPRDVMEGGRLLARVARSSGKVLRGAGAARQDVNVSIAGSRRVEIKGVSSHVLLPRLVRIEAFRHLELLRLRAELERRGVTAADLALPEDDPRESPLVVDAARSIAGAGLAPLHAALERGDRVLALRLPGFGGLLGRRLQPGRDFLSELAERVRVIACLRGPAFLIARETHEAALPLSAWNALAGALRADAGDGLVVLWGDDADAWTAASEVFARAGEALVGVPSETRQAHADGTTGFERILPGPERMYPDTDTPPLPIPDAWLVPGDQRVERPWEREDRYRALGLDARAARELAGAVWADLFDALAPARPHVARRTAAALAKRLVHWRRESGRAVLPEPGRLAPLVRALEAGALRPEALEPALDRLLREDVASETVIAELAPVTDPAELDRVVRRALAAGPRRADLAPDARLRQALGAVIRPLRGRIDPFEARARVEAALAAAAGGPEPREATA